MSPRNLNWNPTLLTHLEFLHFPPTIFSFFHPHLVMIWTTWCPNEWPSSDEEEKALKPGKWNSHPWGFVIIMKIQRPMETQTMKITSTKEEHFHSQPPTHARFTMRPNANDENSSSFLGFCVVFVNRWRCWTTWSHHIHLQLKPRTLRGRRRRKRESQRKI